MTMTSKQSDDLERIVSRLTPEQVRMLASVAYAVKDPVLLLDRDFNLFFASQEAERVLGYRLEHIRLDTTRFQTEKKESFDAIAREFFAKGRDAFDLRNILYQSTDKLYNILMDLHVQRLPDGGLRVQLGNVARYEASKRPGLFQFRYEHAVGDRKIAVKGHIDQRNEKRFREEVEAAYMSVIKTDNKIVIDLSRAQDIVPYVLKALASKPQIIFLNPNEALHLALLEHRVSFDRIQRYEGEGRQKLSPAPAT
jgi:PAS domain-containing protein